LQQMLADGLTGWWVPAARVRHFIPKDRQTIRFLRSHCRGYGQYCGTVEPHSSPRLLFGKPRWAWRKAIEAELKYRFGRLFCKSEHWISHLMLASQMWGYLRSSRDAEHTMSRLLRWLMATETMRYHAHYHASSEGHVVQSRFMSFRITETYLK